MIAALDVQYSNSRAAAACIAFEAWTDEMPRSKHTTIIEHVEPYEPGHFFRRELPSLLRILEVIDQRFDTIIIDGYVWLAESRPGLGAHLFTALGETTPIIGVAKKAFQGASGIEVLRGRSDRPLFVTTAGMDANDAAACIKNMHGEFRIPTLLQRVDHLSRAALASTSD